MKAIEEIGYKKSKRFVLFSLVEIIYHLLIKHLLNLPPFRKYFLMLLGAEIGPDSIIMDVNFFNWHHKGLKGLKIGSECFIGDDTLVDLCDEVIIEDQVTIAQRVTILTHLNVGYKDHPLQKHFPKVSKPVVIKKGAVIGAASTILQGITIGSQAFVAAGSVVTRNVPPKTLVGGVPAKIIRKIA